MVFGVFFGYELTGFGILIATNDAIFLHKNCNYQYKNIASEIYYGTLLSLLL